MSSRSCLENLTQSSVIIPREFILANPKNPFSYGEKLDLGFIYLDGQSSVFSPHFFVILSLIKLNLCRSN